MSNILNLARKIKSNKSKFTNDFAVATVADISPLTFSLYGGEIMAKGDILKFCKTASNYNYEIGEKVLCLVGKSKIIVVDKMVI